MAKDERSSDVDDGILKVWANDKEGKTIFLHVPQHADQKQTNAGLMARSRACVCDLLEDE